MGKLMRKLMGTLFSIATAHASPLHPKPQSFADSLRNLMFPFLSFSQEPPSFELVFLFLSASSMKTAFSSGLKDFHISPAYLATSDADLLSA